MVIIIDKIGNTTGLDMNAVTSWKFSAPKKSSSTLVENDEAWILIELKTDSEICLVGDMAEAVNAALINHFKTPEAPHEHH